MAYSGFLKLSTFTSWGWGFSSSIDFSLKIDNNKHFLIISAYAPHEKLSNDNPDLRTNFYNDLQKALLHRSSHTIVIIALDANAKTSYHSELHPPVLGKFTKGKETNVNGHSLIQFAAENGLFLTNTKFQHKPSHRSTWTSSYHPIRTKNGEIRKNPLRNQIDYVLIDKRHLQFVTDARSVNNFRTETDHNIVIMKLRLQLSKLNKKKKSPTPQR